MCIFSQPVVSVTDTNIFARLLPRGWQYLVYQMNFESKEKNAMVLPLPVALPAKEKESLQFVSLKKYGNFFKDLNKGYPLEPTDGIALGGIQSRSRSLKSKKLKVYNVGDFVASFVPTLKDFDRLDEQFRVPMESWDQIPRYKDYGFAVFQLKSLNGKPHPMAFKFRSRLNQSKEKDGTVFFPTVHIHDGEVHAREQFDHTLFLQSAEFDRACGDYQQGTRLEKDPATGYVRSKWQAKHFCDTKASRGIIRGDALVHRLEMRGTLRNDDVLTSMDPSKSGSLGHSNPNQSNSSLFGGLPIQSLPVIAGVGGVVGMKWLIDRRNSVSRNKSENGEA